MLLWDISSKYSPGKGCLCILQGRKACHQYYLGLSPPPRCVLYSLCVFLSNQLKGISEKFTGTFKFGYSVIFWSIYLSKSCRKSGFISLFIYRIQNKIFILCFNFITNVYFRVIFVSIILNAHNYPCFEDKSSSLTLKYRPVHFSELNCSSVQSTFVISYAYRNLFRELKTTPLIREILYV